jgi:hypothetical protein
MLIGAILFVSSLAVAQRPQGENLQFEMSQSHILIPVIVNETGPYTFLLDTGAGGTIVSTDVIQEIGARNAGEGIAAGMGEGPVGTLVYRNISFRVGALRLQPENVFATSLDVVNRGEGRRVDGIIGYDLFNNHAVEIDCQRQRITFVDASGSQQNGTIRVPLHFINRLPIIDATIQDIAGHEFRCELEIATGAARPLLVTSTYASLHPDLRFSRGITGIPLVGFGHDATQDITRVAQLTIGSYAFNEPVTAISRAETGIAAAQSGIDGIIGGELLQRLRLVLDYPHRQLFFVPQSGSATFPFEYDMSGMGLVAQGTHLDSYSVYYILPQSPASEAGIKVGDVIFTVSGKPASHMALPVIRGIFLQQNKVYDVVVVRNGRKIRKKIKTRRLL